MKKLIWLFLCAISFAQTTNYARMLSGVNYQSGTTYIFQAIDSTRVTQFANAAPVAATIPNGGTVGFQAGTVFTVRNKGAGTATITCSGCTINGAATLALTTGQAVDLYSDGLNFVADQGGGGTSGGSLPSTVYQVLAYGLVCNGTYTGTGTDDTTAFNTLLTTVNSAGGGTIVFPAGQICLFNSAEITLPNNGDTWTDGAGTISSQAAVRWTCGINGQVQYPQLMSTGATISQIQNACVINDTFNAPDAKFVSLGLGHLEVDHIAFIDTSTDSASFWLFTNTQPDFHDNAFIGTTLSQTGGPYSINDVFNFGGATATQPCKVVNCWFQGYAGARIANNFANQIKRFEVFNAAAQTIMTLNNTIWSQSGCSTCGVIEIPGATVGGNTFSYNNFEVVHYLYGINITNTATNTTIIGQTCSDTTEFATICVRSTGSDIGTLVLGGVAPGGSMIGAADLNTSALIFNTGGSLWKSSFHFNGFMNLIDQTSTPVGTAGTGAFFSQFQYLRPAFTKWHQATLFRVVGLEEIPTTQASLATDNFTRANSGTLGANWTAINSLTSLQILSNTAATQATGAYEGNAYTAVTFPNDQYSQCTLGTVVVNSNNFVGCAVRIQSGAQSLYLLRMDTAGSAFCGITKFTAGVQTTLQACSGAGWASGNPPVSGDIVTITAIGNTITAYKNGIQLATTTDSSFPTGSPGIISFASSTAAAIVYTAWAGGGMDCTTGAVTASSVIGGVICGGPLANASTVQKSESAADANVLTFASSTIPATYRVNFVLSTSAANTATLGWTATWTDSNGTAKTPTNLPICAASTGTCAATSGAVSAADDYSGSFLIDTNNSGTNIVIKLTFSGTSFTGKASASVERVQ